MIIEYHRPESLEEAMVLLSRPTPKTIPLGGGSKLSRNSVGDVAVVDLQKLGLNSIQHANNTVVIGACTPLQNIMEANSVPAQLREMARIGLGANTRRQATIAGRIVADDGRSGFLAGLLAMNTQLVWLPGEHEVGLGDFLALRETWRDGQMIREVKIPDRVSLAIECVGRSPADRPILVVAVGRWPSGRTRVVLGGFGKAPILAMDGPEAVGADLAVKDALRHADDEWASAEYRTAVGIQLVKRLNADLGRTQPEISEGNDAEEISEGI
jgi:CO/xanthine dehydrogenase FAD-binding subunit